MNDHDRSNFHTSMTQAGEWESLNPPLSPFMLNTLKNCLKFSQMTPVQANVIPLFMKRKDVVVEAITGSGKTLAFLIPILETLHNISLDCKTEHEAFAKNHIIGLIIAPTRELASQIHSTCLSLIAGYSVTDSCKKKFSCMLAIGGSDVKRDRLIAEENGCNILIGTPGRVAELLVADTHSSEYRLNVKNLEILVFDEADMLLDLGFEQTITKILARLPKQRRTGLFSATMSGTLDDLVKAGLRNPVKICVKIEWNCLYPQSNNDTSHYMDKSSLEKLPENAYNSNDSKIPATLENFYALVPAREKFFFLFKFLANLNTSESSESSSTTQIVDKIAVGEKIIVYFSTCASVDYFSLLLKEMLVININVVNNLTIFALHGKMEQKKRSKIFQQFRQQVGRSVLFCTDVAARGIDIEGIDWVVQFDLPQDPKSFVHRCGRTARIGKSGKALTILMPNEESYLEFLKKRGIFLFPFENLGFCTINNPLSVDNHHLISTGASLSPQIEASTGTNFCSNNESMNFEYFSKFIFGIICSDKLIVNKGIRAFVSYIRSYGEHQLTYLLRIKDLNMHSLIDGYYLAMIPKMPELKEFLKGFDESLLMLSSVVVKNKGIISGFADTITYRDKNVQKQHEAYSAKKQQNWLRMKEKRSDNSRSSIPWSKQKEKKERKKIRKEKKETIKKRALAIAEDESREFESLQQDYKELMNEKKQKLTNRKISLI